MKVRDESLPLDLAPKRHVTPPGRFPRGFAIALLALVAGFALPLWDLATFAFRSDLFSYIFLIPVVSVYLAWSKRATFPPPAAPARGMALLLLGFGVAVLGVYGALRVGGYQPQRADALAFTTAAFALFLAGTCAWFVGAPTLRSLAFPLGFLVFLVPIPASALGAVELFMQHGSAAVARVLFEIVGTPVFYERLIFQIPGISLHVAPECSGIRSTLVLLIVSVVTGYLFLRSPGKRTLLALAIIPLALLRNGFRIFVIGELCVRFGPEMIDSFVHRRGGPIFFALSLVPLFLLLVLLQKREQRSRRASA